MDEDYKSLCWKINDAIQVKEDARHKENLDFQKEQYFRKRENSYEDQRGKELGELAHRNANYFTAITFSLLALAVGHFDKESVNEISFWCEPLAIIFLLIAAFVRQEYSRANAFEMKLMPFGVGANNIQLGKLIERDRYYDSISTKLFWFAIIILLISKVFQHLV